MGKEKKWQIDNNYSEESSMDIGKSLKQLRLEIPETTITFSETNITELKFKLVVQRLDQSLKEKLVSPKSYQEESKKEKEEMDNELLLFDRLEIIKTTISIQLPVNISNSSKFFFVVINYVISNPLNNLIPIFNIFFTFFMVC